MSTAIRLRGAISLRELITIAHGSFFEFEEIARYAEAAWAHEQLDLMSVFCLPYMDKTNRQKRHRELQRLAEGVTQEAHGAMMRQLSAEIKEAKRRG